MDEQPTLSELEERIDIVDWYTLGIQLEIEPTRLEEIQYSRTHINDAKRKMFQLWLETSTTPTRRELIKKLRSRAVGKRKLAQEYKTFAETLVHMPCGSGSGCMTYEVRAGCNYMSIQSQQPQSQYAVDRVPNEKPCNYSFCRILWMVAPMLISLLSLTAVLILYRELQEVKKQLLVILPYLNALQHQCTKANQELQEKERYDCTCTTMTKLTPPSIPLYRYWNPGGGDHFYTTNYDELGAGAGGWGGEGVACRLFATDDSELGVIPLYRYYRPGSVDHFYTTNSAEIGTTTAGEFGKHGYKSEGIVGYCYGYQSPGFVPLYRYWNSGNTDHFYTTNAGEIGTTTPGQVGKHGYKSEGLACYVLPPS